MEVRSTLVTFKLLALIRSMGEEPQELDLERERGKDLENLVSKRDWTWASSRFTKSQGGHWHQELLASFSHEKVIGGQLNGNCTFCKRHHIEWLRGGKIKDQNRFFNMLNWWWLIKWAEVIGYVGHIPLCRLGQSSGFIFHLFLPYLGWRLLHGLYQSQLGAFHTDCPWIRFQPFTPWSPLSRTVTVIPTSEDSCRIE